MLTGNTLVKCATKRECSSRAVDELRSAPCEEANVRKLDLLKKVDDAKRWDKFVKQLR